MNEVILVVGTVGIVFFALCYIIINQMLMLNQVNKRLFIITEQSLNRVPSTSSIGEYDDDLEDTSPYDPHNEEI